MNPTYFFYKTFSQIVTDDFVKFCSTHALEFEVWARPPPLEAKPVVKAVPAAVAAAPSPPVIAPVTPKETVVATSKETSVATPVAAAPEPSKPAASHMTVPEAPSPTIKASAVAPSDVKPQNDASGGGCCSIA